MDDEIVKEVHEARQQIFAECGQDVERLIERLKALDSTCKGRLVTLDQVQERSRPSKTAN
jgi:hypothetical protein